MKKQTGSAHIVVVIVLVAALLGALGFILWQNFMYETPVHPVGTQTIDDSKTSHVSEKGKLVVDKWNIAIPSESEISYTPSSDNPNIIIITSTEIKKAQAKIGCGGHVGVGVLRLKTSKYSADYPNYKTNDINGYTYILNGGNEAVCIDKHGIAPEEVNILDEELYKSLGSDWKKVSAAN
jgi:hypothetical protein